MEENLSKALKQPNFRDKVLKQALGDDFHKVETKRVLPLRVYPVNKEMPDAHLYDEAINTILSSNPDNIKSTILELFEKVYGKLPQNLRRELLINVAKPI